MGLFDKNLSQGESWARMAAGFASMIIGIFFMVYNPMAFFMALVGVYFFGEGYYQVSVFNNLRGGR